MNTFPAPYSTTHLPPHIARFLNTVQTAHRRTNTPHTQLYLDEATIRHQIEVLQTRLLPPQPHETGHTTIYYAVKTNPHPNVLRTVHATGQGFDVASTREIDAVLAVGANPSTISYGNTVKTPAEIRYAHRKGITVFVADSHNELATIGANAPHAEVFLRIHLPETSGTTFHLSHKFGANPDSIPALARTANRHALTIKGISFHVGSHQTSPQGFHQAFHLISHHPAIRELFTSPENPHPPTLNIGGGLPSYHHAPPHNPAPFHAFQATFATWTNVLNSQYPGLRWSAEPGRFLVGEAGIVATHPHGVNMREGFPPYLILPLGMYSGLNETRDIAPIIVTNPENPANPHDVEHYIVAGPTCDSEDTMNRGRVLPYPLPAPSLMTPEMPLYLLSQGAYTQTLSSHGFNGFPNPLLHPVWVEG